MVQVGVVLGGFGCAVMPGPVPFVVFPFAPSVDAPTEFGFPVVGSLPLPLVPVPLCVVPFGFILGLVGTGLLVFALLVEVAGRG